MQNLRRWPVIHGDQPREGQRWQGPTIELKFGVTVTCVSVEPYQFTGTVHLGSKALHETEVFGEAAGDLGAGYERAEAAARTWLEGRFADLLRSPT